MKNLILVVFLVLISGTANAQSYIEARGLVANLEEPSDNIGGSLAFGYDGGIFRLEAVAMHHMHLGNATAAALVMGYADIGDWWITPYIGIGGGSTIENGEFDHPVIQGSVGISIDITDRLALTAGYTHRSYFEKVSAITSDNFGVSEDGTALVGIRASF